MGLKGKEIVNEWKFPTPSEVETAMKGRNEIEVQAVLNEIIDSINTIGEVVYRGRCMYKPVAYGVSEKLLASGWDCDIEVIGTFNGTLAYTVKKIRPKEVVPEVPQ